MDEATKEMCGQVIYPAAVLKAAPNAETAKEFLAYLQTDKAMTVFAVSYTHQMCIRDRAAAGAEPILNVLPMQAKKFAVITTGSEVFKGRIEDKFTPILVGKLAEYGLSLIHI